MTMDPSTPPPVISVPPRLVYWAPRSQMRRLRIWPVWCTIVIVPVVIFGAQIILSIGLLFLYAAQTGVHDLRSVNTAAFVAYITESPWIFVLSGLMGQFTILMAALVPAWFSPENLRYRLRLTRPRGRIAPLVWIVIAGFSVNLLTEGFIALCEYHKVHLPLDHLEHMNKSIRHASGLAAVAVFIMVSIAAPIGEELLCRGYIQSRLQRRWNPMLAVLIASAYFAFLHFDLVHSSFAFVFGFYVGIAAWRTGSTCTGICIHAFNNILASLGISMGFLWTTEARSILAVICAAAIFISGVLAMLRITPGLPRRRQSIPQARSDDSATPAHTHLST